MRTLHQLCANYNVPIIYVPEITELKNRALVSWLSLLIACAVIVISTIISNLLHVQCTALSFYTGYLYIITRCTKYMYLSLNTVIFTLSSEIGKNASETASKFGIVG